MYRRRFLQFPLAVLASCQSLTRQAVAATSAAVPNHASVAMADRARSHAAVRHERSLAARLAALEQAASPIERLNTLAVMHQGEVVYAQNFRGPPANQAVNVKSVSKSLVAATVGAALFHEVLSSVDSTLAEIAAELVPAEADPRVGALTVEQLLTMQAGLQRTSGPYYGPWVTSDDWVHYVLSRPFEAEPGARMLYSTGDWHVLGAILTSLSGKSLHTLTQAWLGDPLDIDFAHWTRDPQGRYLGGNEMAISPLEMLRVGELYRQQGDWQGHRVFGKAWATESFTPRTRSPWSGDAYGYGWFIRDMGGTRVAYARGYGGQLLHIIPEQELVVAMTSNSWQASRGDGYVDRLHALVETHLLG